MTRADPSAAARTRPLRADARANLQRVLDGARRAFAELGLDASYHDIARSADVGIGTVYRRFPDRRQLLEEVLLDILGELDDVARNALATPDPWVGFCALFTALAQRFRENAGLSDRLDDHGGARVSDARRRLLNGIENVKQRAQDAGALRVDVSSGDVVALASSLPRGERCAFEVQIAPADVERLIAVMLSGLAAAD